MPDPSVVRRHKGLLRHTLHQLLHVDLVRYGVAAARFVWFTKVRRRLVTVRGDAAVAEHTVHHNLRGLRDLAVNRSLFLVRPLSTVERLAPDSPLLVVGPRTEGELLALLAHGFDRSALCAVDLISYSPWVQPGDLHDLPFEADRFEAVMLGWVLAYSEDPRRAAAEIVRVAGHGAVVAVGVEWNPVDDEVILVEHGYRPGAGHRITSVDQVLDYFEPHVGEVLVREDVPADLRNRLGAIVVLFTVDKSGARP